MSDVLHPKILGHRNSVEKNLNYMGRYLDTALMKNKLTFNISTIREVIDNTKWLKLYLENMLIIFFLFH